MTLCGLALFITCVTDCIIMIMIHELDFILVIIESGHLS